MTPRRQRGRSAAPEAAPATRPEGQGAWSEWVPIAVAAALGVALYLRALLLGFIADDYLFLDAARRLPLAELLTGRHAILGYYRPVSRELYFWLWGRVLGLDADAMHLLNAATFAATAALLMDVVRRGWGSRVAVLTLAWFVVFPPVGALLSWISCAQDLIALFWTALALWLHQRGRATWTAPAVLLAALSKETAVIAPALLLALDLAMRPGDGWGVRVRRLAPSLAGLAVAVAISLAVRATWPAGTAVAVWSPSQFLEAWHLPLDFFRSFWPPDLALGIRAEWQAQAWLVVLAAALGALTVPNAAHGADARSATAGGSGTTLGAPGTTRGLMVFGVAAVLLGLLPVGAIAERWRGYFFCFAALGSSVLLAAACARAHPWAARLALAAAAVVSLGSNSVYRPLETASGPARHPHVNYAFFRDSAELMERMLGPIRQSCDALRAAPRLFAVGVPGDVLFQTVLGPGLRVACRDTALSVRFLSQFGVDDAHGEFGLLRYLPREQRLVVEPVNALSIARIGEGFLMRARYDVAAACFERAVSERPADPELIYPRVLTLAAAGHAVDARAAWAAAVGAGVAMSADTLLARMSYGARAASRDPIARALGPLVAAVHADPADAGAQSRLGRTLLAIGLDRQATLALVVASGIGHQPSDVVYLARAFDAGGQVDLAREAYRQALQAGLPAELYEQARRRFAELGPMAPSSDAIAQPGFGRFPGDEPVRR